MNHRRMWAIGATGFVVLAIALFGVISVTLQTDGPFTVSQVGRMLEKDGWRFASDKATGGVRFFLYEKAMGDVKFTAEFIEDFEKPGGLVWSYQFSARGPADTKVEKLTMLAIISSSLKPFIPDAPQAISRAVGAFQEIRDTGLRRNEGVATTRNAWRITVIEYLS
jgi:hypothetical protein